MAGKRFFGLMLATACIVAAPVPAGAAEVHRQMRTANGSDVTLFKDGSATLINAPMRWNFSGQWQKEGRKDCVNWSGRALKQCY